MEDNKISVGEFVNKGNGFTSEQLKLKYVKDNILLDKYVPYGEKIVNCKHIIDSSYYVKEKTETKEIKKVFHINSPMYYMFYCLSMIRDYTKIKIDFTKSIDEFDLLNKYGYIDLILGNMNQKELKEVEMLLKMIGNDVIQNEQEIHSFITNNVNALSEVLSVSLKPLAPKLLEILNKKN